MFYSLPQLLSFLESKLLCLLCGSHYANRSGFSRHFASSHTVYGPNRQCAHCNQYFFTRRNMLRHSRAYGRCPGKPMLYCVRTGRIFYFGPTEDSMASGFLCTRKTRCENALIAVSHQDECCMEVAIDEPRVVYSIGELPLRDATGQLPLFVLRDFAPEKPDWRQKPGPAISQSAEPGNRGHLNWMLATLNMGECVRFAE